MEYPRVVQDLLNEAGVVVSNSIIEIAWWVWIPALFGVLYIPYKPFIAFRRAFGAWIEPRVKGKKILGWMWFMSVCFFAIAADKTQYDPMQESDMPILQGTLVKASSGWKGSSDSLRIEIDDHQYGFGIGDSIRAGQRTMKQLKSLPTGTPIDVSIKLARFNYKIVPRVAKIVIENEAIYVESPYKERVASFKEHQRIHYLRLLFVVILSYFFFRKRKIKSKMDLR